MAGFGEVDIVRTFFGAGFDERPRLAQELLTADVVIKASDGDIYVGHEGWQRAHEMAAVGDVEPYFEERSAELLSGGWVLVAGAAVIGSADGTEQRRPGWWLVHVRDGRIAAVLYYRTEREARISLAS